jgi:hypothetical protein
LIVGYALLWVEGMAVALLCLALAARAAAKGSVLRVAGTVAVFLIFAGLAALATHGTARWQSEYGKFLAADLFVYFLSWLLAYLVAAALLLRRAFQRPAPGLARAGAGWPRGQLWLGLGGAVLAWGLTFWNLDLAARADMAVARQEAGDLLLTMSPPGVGDSENATRLYIEAGKDLQTPIRNPWHDAARQGMSAHPQQEVSWKDPYIVGLVAGQDQVLALLRKAAAMPACNLGGRRSLEEFGEDRELAKLRWEEITLLAVDARVKAVQGDRTRALEDIAAILGSARHVQTFLSGPAVLGTHTTTWRTLEDVLRLAPAGKEPLPSVAFPEVVSPLRTLYREMAVFGMIWPAVFSDDPLLIPELRRDAGPWSKPPLVYLTTAVITPGCRILFTPGELAYARTKWEAYRRVLHAPPEGTPQDWAALRTTVEAGPTGLFSALLVKPREQVLLRHAGSVAALEQLARAGLAAARYRQKHGHYPERLEQLVPEFLPAMPVDPRDGRALRLKRFPKLTVLYTAQSNGELAKATAWDAEKYREEPVFRLFP